MPNPALYRIRWQKWKERVSKQSNFGLSVGMFTHNNVYILYWSEAYFEKPNMCGEFSNSTFSISILITPTERGALPNKAVRQHNTLCLVQQADTLRCHKITENLFLWNYIRLHHTRCVYLDRFHKCYGKKNKFQIWLDARRFLNAYGDCVLCRFSLLVNSSHFDAMFVFAKEENVPCLSARK